MKNVFIRIKTLILSGKKFIFQRVNLFKQLIVKHLKVKKYLKKNLKINEKRHYK